LADNALRIAMVAPPWYPVPPEAYGGIEQLIADLVRPLADLGHKVTLIGVGDDPEADLVDLRTFDRPQSYRMGEALPEVLHAARANRLIAAMNVDVVHDHSLAGPITATARDARTVLTVHGPVTGELGELYDELGDSIELVAISEAQRSFRPDLNWVATVHNAIDVAEFPYRDDKQDYVLFLGRMCHDKGVHLAVDAARAAGRRLLIAAKCNEDPEYAYFEEYVRPRLGPDVEYLGEADVARKRELLRDASCLLLPVLWEEPFGLVMVEALACGTPVVALRRGSVPEVIVDGVTGLVCDDPEELPAALEEVRRIDPRDCRLDAEHRFDLPVMARAYERVYLGEA
jgi:glycosyltransferase involved in cell wall biosynthesis